MRIYRYFLKTFKDHTAAVLVLAILFLATTLTLPVLKEIPPHPDEHEFYFNALNILLGKPLNNYLHVASTEYLLAFFLLLTKIFTYPGVDLFSKEITGNFFNYGRVLGFCLYLTAFFLGSLVLTKGQFKISARHVFFAVLYFGSLGVFERFLRLNSEAVAVLVFLNYFYLSFVLIERKASPRHFFFLDLFFVFLMSFTNLKELSLVLPILMTNIIFAVFVSRRSELRESEIPLRIYKGLAYFLGFVVGTILLWSLLIPKPFEARLFWNDLTTVIQSNTVFDFNYPSQAYRSWLFYPYDLAVEYFGLTALASLLVLVGAYFLISRRTITGQLMGAFKNKITASNFYEGNFYSQTELLLGLSFMLYYLVLAHGLIHWSRWSLPLAIPAFILTSLFLEKVFFTLRAKVPLNWFFPVLALLFILAWALRILLFVDLKSSAYSEGNGYRLISRDVEKFLGQQGVSASDKDKKAVWFGSVGGGLRNISLDQVVEKENEKVSYILWPYWNIGLLYTHQPVDKTTHNQKAFVAKYSQSVTYRFPTFLSHYMHATKYFAWKNLNLTWNPEIDSLVEAQYAVVKLKERPAQLDLSYTVAGRDLSNCGQSLLSPCRPNPGPRQSLDLTAQALPRNHFDHSLWFRNLFRGDYKVRIISRKNIIFEPRRVYATQDFEWQPEEKALIFKADKQLISVEVGFTSRDQIEPALALEVTYHLE